MKLINMLIWWTGIQLVPRMTSKMWHEEANVMETSGYPCKSAVVQRFRRSASWAAR